MIYRYYGYPKDFIFQYQKAIAAVTKADVLRVAKEYFRPEDLTIVAVGNPDSSRRRSPRLALKVLPIDLSIPEAKKENTKSDAATQAQAARARSRTNGDGRRRQAGAAQRHYL